MVAAEPTPTTAECIAASESGQDLRHAGKLLDARVRFKVCISRSCPGPIREDCAQRLGEIANSMPSIFFDLKDGAGHDAVGVIITMDGQRLASSPGNVIELDPGEHTFTFEAAEQTKVEKRFVIAEGVKRRREVIVFVDAVKKRAEAIDIREPLIPAATTSGRTKEDLAARPSGPPVLAWTAFGVGGAGLTLGVIAGLVAGGRHSTLERECNNTAGTCAPQYASDLDSFHTWRTVSTVGYVVGGFGLAGGVALWLTAPKASNNTALRGWFGPSSAGIAGKF